MIKAKKGFLRRRLGDEYMVVAIGEASKKLQRHDSHERDRRLLLERAGAGYRRGRFGSQNDGALHGRNKRNSASGCAGVSRSNLDRSRP